MDKMLLHVEKIVPLMRLGVSLRIDIALSLLHVAFTGFSYMKGSQSLAL